MSKSKPAKRRVTAKKPTQPLSSQFALLRNQLSALISQHQHLSKQVAQMEKSHRGEAHDIQADQRRIASALYRIERELHPPVQKGEMMCSVCKKGQSSLSFTYETSDGQLCESCWLWHERVRQASQQGTVQ